MEASYAMSNAAVTPAMLESLRQTRPWVRFLSILGYLVAILMICAAVFVGAAGSLTSLLGDKAQAFPPVVAIGIAALYVVMAIIYLFPCTYLFRYASAISRAVRTSSATDVEVALRLQKSFWKFVGIMTLIVIIAEILFAIVGIIAAVAIPMFMKHG